MPDNPNGSVMAVEGLVSPCGKIFGRMGHSERVEEGTFLNISGVENVSIFKMELNTFNN